MTPAASRLYWTLFTAWHARGQSRVPFLPPERLAAIQSRRVRRIVAHAYDTVPFYREGMARAGLTPADFRTADDLERLPLATADDLARDPERFCARSHQPGDGVELLTSGTTGHRKRVVYDRRYVFMAWAAAQRRRDVVSRLTGIPRHARTLEFRIPVSTATILLEEQRRHSFAPSWMVARRHVHPVTSTVAAAIEAVNAVAPDVIHAYGTFAGSLFREAARAGFPIHRPRLVIAHSDALPPADRTLIEEGFGVPVISMYVAAESGFIACQCEQRRGFHIDVDRVAVRVVDAEGRRVPSGQQGEIVVSNLTNRATVILNYRLGDLVTLSERPCPCGRTLPTLDGIDGRTANTFAMPDGSSRRAVPILIEMQARPGVLQVQLRQERLRSFVVRAVLGSGADREEFVRLARRLMSEALGDDAEVAIELVARIPPDANGKVRAVVNGVERPTSG